MSKMNFSRSTPYLDNIVLLFSIVEITQIPSNSRWISMLNILLTIVGVAVAVRDQKRRLVEDGDVFEGRVPLLYKTFKWFDITVSK